MTNITFAEYEIRTMPTEVLKHRLELAKDGVAFSIGIAPHQYVGFIYGELIRRHSAECQDLECGFNPLFD